MNRIVAITIVLAACNAPEAGPASAPELPTSFVEHAAAPEATSSATPTQDAKALQTAQLLGVRCEEDGGCDFALADGRLDALATAVPGPEDKTTQGGGQPQAKDTATTVAADTAIVESGLEVTLMTSQGHAAIPVVEGSVYSVPIIALSPGLTSTLVATAGGTSSEAQLDPGLGVPASVAAAALNPTVYADVDVAQVAVQVRDGRGAAVHAGVSVTGRLETQMAACSTDDKGICVLEWDAAQLTAGQHQAEITVEQQVTHQTVTVNAADALAMTSAGMGLQLPQGPVAQGHTVDVPVYARGNTLPVGAWDMAVTFDVTQFRVLSVVSGTCAAYGQPVHNAGATANTTGVLNLNGIKAPIDAECLDSATVHVATIRFQATAEAKGPAMIGCAVQGLFDVNFTTLTDAGTECATAGALLAMDNALVHAFASVETTELFDWSPIVGEADAADVTLTAWHRDGERVEIADAALTSSAPLFAAIADGQVVAAGAGAASITATSGGVSATVSVRSFGVSDVDLSLSDHTLSRISGTTQLQTARLRVHVTWTDAASVTFVQDVTSHILPSQVGVPAALIFDAGAALLTAATSQAGQHTVLLSSPTGSSLASAPLAVNPSDVVTVDILAVAAPCAVSMTTSLTGDGLAVASITVDPVIAGAGDTCSLAVFAHFSDLTHSDVTDHGAVSVTSLDSAVASLNGRILTATSAGEVSVQAEWAPSGLLGVTSVTVQ